MPLRHKNCGYLLPETSNEFLMKHFKFIAFLVILSLSLGCATQSIRVEIMRPAPVTLPMSVKKIGIIDRSALTEEQYKSIYFKSSILSKYKDLPKVAALESILALTDKLNGFGRFSIVELSPTDTENKSGYISNPLSWKTAEQLASANGLQAIISLEGIYVDAYTEGMVTDAQYATKEGVAFTIPYFTDSRQINIQSTWRIYNTQNKTIASEKTEKADYYFSGNGTNNDPTYKTLPNRRGNVQNVAQIIGINYSSLLIPYWESITREFYVGNDSKWLDAADSALVKNWPSAAEQWLKLAKSSKLSVFKKQAYHNLALAHEMMERFDEALSFAQNGYRNYKSKGFKNYIEILNQRKDEARILDLQFGEQK